jgi:hypothetical protein
MVMLLKVLRHELLFYGGMLAGAAQVDIVTKVGPISGGGATCLCF